ncbi:MAG: sugar phosphate isomerase/epimerase [Flammeovirgaceae bacterium]|nr:sugar phosphate isomerase/epimerase [Flammeovirgaceae bacterium]
MDNEKKRRIFLQNLGKSTAALTLAGGASSIIWGCSPKQGGEQEIATGEEEKGESNLAKELFFDISIAEWSLHKTLFANKLTNMEFPAKAKNEFSISAVEYVNQFFKDKAKDMEYLKELKQRTIDLDVKNVLIMIDGEGNLGSTDAAERNNAVENHYKWVEAAKFLGCHSIRVNAAGKGTAEEVSGAAVEALGKLSTFAKELDIGVIVENHGGYSSDGTWLANVMKQVNLPNSGTLPDFGNFCIERGDDGCANEYDRYKGVDELMPFAKGVSAKAMGFDEQGNCTETDFTKIMKIVKSHGYKGYVGIEYSGSVPEDEGIILTKKLLEKVGAEIS